MSPSYHWGRRRRRRQVGAQHEVGSGLRRSTQGKAGEIKARITQIEQQLEEATSDCDNKEQLQERMARLFGGVALIRVQEALEKLESANEDAAVVLADVKKGKGNYGYDAGPLLDPRAIGPSRVSTAIVFVDARVSAMLGPCLSPGFPSPSPARSAITSCSSSRLRA